MNGIKGESVWSFVPRVNRFPFPSRGHGGYNFTQKIKVTVASVLDVSNVIILPDDSEFLRGMDEKMIFQCMFFHPNLTRFSEVRGFRARLQDVFQNIRENRHLAWVCVDFSKLFFIKLKDQLEMRITGKTYNSELIVRLYTKEFDVARTMACVYQETEKVKEDADTTGLMKEYYEKHLDIVRHQIQNFDEVCVNDLLSLYSRFVIQQYSLSSIAKQGMIELDEC